MAGMGKRYLLWFCVAFVGTVMIYSLCNTALVFLAVWGLLIGAMTIALCVTDNRISAAIVIIAAVLSLLWQSIYYDFDRLPDSLFTGERSIIAEVVSYNEETDTNRTFVRVRTEYEGKNVRLALYINRENVILSPGDKIIADVNVTKLENTEFFAEKTYYKSRYTDAIAFADGIAVVSRNTRIRSRFLPVWLEKHFKETSDRIYNEKTSGFLKSLILGDKSGISDDFTESLKRTGMSHAVSVSGMHIAFIMGFIVFFSKNKYFKLLSVPVILLFALVVGAPQSALRAVIMQSMIILAGFSKREYDKLTAVAFAAFVLVAINPHCATDIAFVLSFSATLGIVLLYEPLSQLFSCFTVKTKSILRKWSVDAVCVVSVSLSASLFTSPISAYSFGSVSLIAPIVNVLLNFLISCMFTFGFINTVLGFLCPAFAKVVGVLLGSLSEFIMFAINLMAKLPFSSVRTHNPMVLAAVIFVCFVITYAILAGKKKVRVWYALILVAVAIPATVLGAYFSPSVAIGDGMRVDVLDVGQGQCIVARMGESCAVIDCGGDKDADNIAIEHLLRNRVDEIDVMILTHAHADHANGVEYLTETIPTKTMYMPASDKENATFIRLSESAGSSSDVLFVEEDTDVKLGDMTIKILALPKGSDENENGISVLLCDGEYEVLITGDIAQDYEKLLLSRIPDCEAYIAGHHGSKSSSSQALLNKALPELCVISVGEGNSYGHPSKEAMKRIENVGAKISRTDIEGTISFCSRKEEVGK